MDPCQRSACLPPLWLHIPDLLLVLVLQLVAKCKSSLLVAVGLVFSWMSSWVWLNARLKCSEESAEMYSLEKSRLVLITLSWSLIWTRLRLLWTCSLMSLVSTVLTLLHGFQIGFGLYLADLESEEGYLSFPSYLCRHTLQGPDELSERGNLKDERFFWIPAFLNKMLLYSGML